MFHPLYGVALVLLALAVVTGLFGFGAITDEAPLVAKLFSGLLLIASVGAFWFGWITRTSPDTKSSR